jgi:hypothetical protein
VREDIENPGRGRGLLPDIREEAVGIIDPHRQDVKMAGAVQFTPATQKLARFAERRLGDRHDDVPIGCGSAVSAMPRP